MLSSHQRGDVSALLSQAQLLHVNGTYQQSSDKTRFAVNNPMTGEKIYDSASATLEDYATAIDSAHEAFATWSRFGPSARRLVFLRAADIIESYMDEASEVLAAEVSATAAWVKVNVHATAGVFRESAGLVTHIKGEIVPADRPGTTVLVAREPVGVVFAISPWNAPINLTARAIACPLICGNTIVLKPSEFSPKSQNLAIRALLEAGLPKGCLNFLPTSPERAPAVTEVAVKHPKVLRVNFTGSDRVGRIIAGWAATCLKKCVLELGGKAPVLVLDDANVDDAVEAIIFGAFANSGQVCMSTERAIVHKSIASDFKAKLVARTQALKTGNHLEDVGVSVSGLFTPASAARVQALLQDTVDRGAKLLTGDLKVTSPNQTIIAPHIFEGVTRDMDLYHKESFGPAMIISEFETDKEGITLANDSEYSLCASVFSRDVMRAMDIAKQIRAGSCHVNGPTIYAEGPLPNGGTGGSSGYGRFGGMAGVEEFTERKMISLTQSGRKFPF